MTNKSSEPKPSGATSVQAEPVFMHQRELDDFSELFKDLSLKDIFLVEKLFVKHAREYGLDVKEDYDKYASALSAFLNAFRFGAYWQRKIGTQNEAT